MQHAEPDARAEAKARPNMPADGPWTGIGFARSCNDPGDVGIIANRFFMLSGPSGDNILLASIDFTGNSTGTSSLVVGYYTGGPGDNVLFDFTVLDSSSSFFQSGSLNIVPEPHTALLFGMGLMFLGVRQRCPHSHQPDRFFGKGN